MAVIDFRFRPNTKETMAQICGSPIFKTGLQESSMDFEAFAASGEDLAEIASDLKRHGLMRAVVVGRDAETTYHFKPNHQEILPYMTAYPELFIGFVGLDPHKGMESVWLLDEMVRQGFAGAAIDPMYAQLAVNSAKYYPIYAECCKLDIPVVITTGLSPASPGTALGQAAPCLIDEVARDFPQLKIVVSHGGYPWVMEMIGVAHRHANIYLEFSEYETMPQSGAYIEAANGILQNKMLFASAHPFVNYKAALALYQRLPFIPEVREKIMWQNACRLLKLERVDEINLS